MVETLQEPVGLTEFALPAATRWYISWINLYLFRPTIRRVYTVIVA